MSLSQGRSYLAIPGPSVMPDQVLRAMQRAAPNIYAGELMEMMPGIITDLKTIAGTQFHCAPYIGNGHMVWDVALANVLAEGDHALCLATGRFGLLWADMADGLGIHVDIHDYGRRDPIDLDRLDAALRADSGHQIKAVLMTHVDTATGRKNDPAAVRAVLDAADHPALLMVDCIASLGCDEYRMDDWGADITIAACQKGLMTPPGMAFVFFNNRAQAARGRMTRVARHYDWQSRIEGGILANYFNGTPPTHLLYALRAALDLILTEGLDHVWTRHHVLARAIWAACDAWGQGGAMQLNIPDPAARSHAVTAARLNAPDGTRLRNWLEANTGVTLGIGLGMDTPEDPHSSAAFRFGHMGHINAQMVMGMLGSVDMGLKALSIAHGDGALEAASRICADHLKQG